MTITTWIRIGIAVVAVALGTGAFVEWRSERRAQIELQAELKATKQALADAGAQQQARESDLNKVLAQINEQKATVKKPAEIVKALPEVLPLPKPLEIEEQLRQGAPTGTLGGESLPDAPKVLLPGEDLKPLYDFALDCKACKAQLSAAQGDLKDEQLKTQALSRERDDALRVARGGTVMKRVLRAAKWFAIGAAAGAVAVKLKR